MSIPRNAPTVRTRSRTPLPAARRATTTAASVLALALAGATVPVLTAPAAFAATSTLEAESSTLSGGAVVQREHAGYTGGGYVGGYTDGNKGKASTAYTVQSGFAGKGSVKVRYANGTGSTMTLSLFANGTRATQLSLPATSGWASWSTVEVPVDYVKGANTLAVTFTSADSGNVNLDHVTATTPDSATAPDPSVLEAESAALSGGAAVERTHAGYTGSGYAGGYTDGNKGKASTAFTVQSGFAGRGALKVRYANGTGATMTLSLFVNGTKATQVSLPATSGWASWSTVEVPVDYAKGANTVALTFTSTDSGNVNLDHVTATTPTGGGDPGPSTLTHEAELAFASGGPVKADTGTGHSGGGYLTGFTAVGARAVFAVQVPGAGERAVTVRYRTPGAQAASLTLAANGHGTTRVALPATSGEWKSVTVRPALRSGLNHVQLRNESGDSGNVQLDGLAVTDSTAIAQRGATVPYTAYEVESGTTNGRVLAPDRTYLTTASEASGRRAVVLEKSGDYAQITLTKPANALVLRYSLPDTADGKGLDATLSVDAGGQALPKLALTSKYAWVYGAYPYTNTPSLGEAHRFFDETRVQLGRTLPAGSVVRFHKAAGDTAANYTLDLVEAETAPEALAMPAGYVSATTLGVTADDAGDDTASLNSALRQASAQGRGLWLPKGVYRISGEVTLQGVRLAGAGVWHTELRGKDGKGVLFGRGGTSAVQDLAILGDVSYRNDAGFDAAIEGDFGTGSTLQNVWIEHTKVGLWIDGPTKGLYVAGLRIRDTFADGVNLHKGTADTLVTHTNVRNTGDDGLAMWSETTPVTDSAFRHNTVQLPMLANGAAVYGGSGNRVEDNVIADTVVASAGVAVSTRFGLPFSGPVTVARNSLVRTGGYEHNWQSKLGALWVYADASEITTPVIIQNNEILDSTYSGLLVSWQKRVADLRVTDTLIDRTGHHGVEIYAAGRGSFSGVTVRDTAAAPLSLAGGFTVDRGAGNVGW